MKVNETVVMWLLFILLLIQVPISSLPYIVGIIFCWFGYDIYVMTICSKEFKKYTSTNKRP